MLNIYSIFSYQGKSTVINVCPKCRSENPPNSRVCVICGLQLDVGDDLPIAHTKTMETPAGELKRGSTFAGRYEIIEELGRGGMGRVYRVEDKKTREELALKLIKPEIASDKRTIERFANELTITHKITHPSVCRMHHLGEEKGSYYITMEYVPGEDLKSFIKRAAPLSTARTIAITKQVCEGLSEAHKHGIVHRDLKPANIMIDKEGNARIMDFGIARSVQAKRITGQGMMIGTPEYMSPEQVEAKEIDLRSDIYSLGIILYEMTTGSLPFEADTPFAVGIKHKSETPINPKELNPQIPDNLNRLILKCLEKEKEKRFLSTNELAIELEKTGETCHGQEGIQEKTDKDRTSGKLSEILKKKKKNPFFILGLLLLGAVIFAGGYFLLKKNSAPEQPEEKVQAADWDNSIAVLPFRDISPAQNQEHLSFGMADAINDRLTQLDVLKVTATTSVMRYKNTEKDIREIGQELGVKNILEGSILVEDDSIRVTAQLIDAESGFHLWSDRFDRKLERIIDVQDDVSQAIAEALKIELLPDAFSDLEKDRPKNFEAYNLYLKAMNFISSRYLITIDNEDFITAVDMFKKALEVDPDYSLAYSGLAWGYMLRGAGLGQPSDFKEMAKYNEKAYELDPDSAMASIMRAASLHLGGNFEEAIKYCEQALEINSNLSEVNFTVGVVCRQLGLLHKAQKYFKKSIALDPYFALSYGALGRIYTEQGDSATALAYWEKGAPMMAFEFFQWLAREHMILGNLDRAEDIIKDAEKSGFDPDLVQGTQAYLYAYRGEKDIALELRQSAEIFALLDMKKEALDIIEGSLDRPLSYNYLYLKNYPLFDNLRSDPRYERILAIQKKKYEERLQWAAAL